MNDAGLLSAADDQRLNLGDAIGGGNPELDRRARSELPVQEEPGEYHLATAGHKSPHGERAGTAVADNGHAAATRDVNNRQLSRGARARTEFEHVWGL